MVLITPVLSFYEATALFWQVSAWLIQQVNRQLKPNQRVAALAVASMAESGVLADADGPPLTPVLNWYDRRTTPWNDWWRRRLDEADIFQITDLPLDHIYSAHKLLWRRRQGPAIFARARSWLSLSDWIAFCLTRATSYSQATRYKPDSAPQAIYNVTYRDVFLKLYNPLRGLPLAPVGKD